MSDQGGLPQGSDPPQKPSPPIQTAATLASFSKYLMNNAPPSVWDCWPLEINKPLNSSELGENWSPLSDGNTIFGGNSSNDCWSGSLDLRMNLEKKAAERRSYTDEKGKKVDVEALRIDAKTKLSPLDKKFENINNGKLVIPDAWVEKLMTDFSEKSTNSPTNKIDGDEIISSATDRAEIIFEEMASAPAHKNERVSLEPEIGMEFPYEKDAHKFYENYAERCGFKIRKGKVEWSSDGCVKKRILLCSREGFRSKKPPNTTPKYARKETRTGCNARIKIIAQNGKWVISDLCLKHSHGQEALAQTHKGDSSTSVSKVESQPHFVTEAEIESMLEPAAWSYFFGLIDGFQEKEKDDALSVTSVTTKIQSDCPNTPQTLDPSVINLENSSTQVKSCSDNVASSSKEIQPFYTNIDDKSIEKFYTNLGSADQNHSSPHVSTHAQGKEQRELEIYDAIELLRTLFKDKLSVVIRSRCFLPLNSALRFLSSFTKESNLSIALKSVCLKLVGVIPSILYRYNETKIVIDKTNNVKAAIDSMNGKLMENKRLYLELSNTRKAIVREIGQIEKQFNKLQAKAKKQLELRDEVSKKIQSTYTEGTSLKRKADELDGKVAAMELEKVCAEQTRLELKDEWDKLGKLLDQNLGK